ncbi:MAG TPA: ester cyclase [Gaiellaceae bacterium]|nr:ester cyclase [Gaiellaceae bacterium]
MSAANKELSRRFTELFSTGDEAAAREVLSPDVVFHGTSGDGEIVGIEAMLGFLAGYRAAFPDARSTVEGQVAEGDKVVTRWRAAGTHQGALGPIEATGRPFAIDGVTIERVADGRIAEVWVVRDELGLLRQLGVVPEPAEVA